MLLTEDCPRNLQQRVHGPGILSAYFSPKPSKLQQFKNCVFSGGYISSFIDLLTACYVLDH